MNLLRLFIDHLKIDNGASVHTQQAYERDLIQFQEHCALKTPSRALQDITENDVQSFLKDLKKREHQSSSIARKVSALKQFYKFLILENIVTDDPTLFIEAPVRSQKLPKALDEKSILALLDAVDQGLPYPAATAQSLHARDQAMVYLLYAAGLRASELTQLATSQIDIEAGYLRVLGKRNKERMVPFAPIAGEKLYTYLTTARPLLKPNTDKLFVGIRGEPLTRQALWKTLKRLATQAGIESSLHPHVLRHTFATDLLKSGMNLRSLQMLLGHADLQTTQIYTHVAPEMLADVIKKYHPRGR